MPSEALIQKLTELAKGSQETRSRRMQILVTPSIADALDDLSKQCKLSKNELVNLALAQFLEG